MANPDNSGLEKPVNALQPIANAFLNRGLTRTDICFFCMLSFLFSVLFSVLSSFLILSCVISFSLYCSTFSEFVSLGYVVAQ